MSRGFKELENITADLGIEGWGEDLEDAFSSVTRGLISLLSDLPAHDQPLTRNLQVSASSLSGLLVRFLNEIIFLEETEDFLPGDVTRLRIREATLDATLTGALFDPRTHTIHTHIKAATYHGLEITQEGGLVRIRVIFDV